MSQPIITTKQLSGLHCDSCQKLIGNRVKRIPGVQNVTVYPTGKTEISADRNISDTEVEQVLVGSHYQIVK